LFVVCFAFWSSILSSLVSGCSSLANPPKTLALTTAIPGCFTICFVEQVQDGKVDDGLVTTEPNPASSSISGLRSGIFLTSREKRRFDHLVERSHPANWSSRCGARGR
jgi:hypothetical protein